MNNKKLKVLITRYSRRKGRGIAKSKTAKLLNLNIRYIQADLATLFGISKIKKLIESNNPPISIYCLGIEKK
tara:strand:- start:21252 stop:21467 length:216 start_codon:yes stop_codon:yes gene_type:complete